MNLDFFWSMANNFISSIYLTSLIFIYRIFDKFSISIIRNCLKDDQRYPKNEEKQHNHTLHDHQRYREFF